MPPPSSDGALATVAALMLAAPIVGALVAYVRHKITARKARR